ncbi:hypothetical protein MTR67_052178 [Solanum verrucosum]|uniref:Uncharacterized protein n=1 Tax=Solanum verrucosum TaxID=315347 RepID=A0AAF0V4L2_SOLVR|nr:hypothetical protein MTR67_052178 [Solanum verrucosum]
MGVYIGQEVGQGVLAKQVTPMSTMQAACVEGGAEDLGCTKGLSLSAKAVCGEAEGYSMFYERGNGMKLHGSVKEVKKSNYNQTTPHIEFGRAVYGLL